MEEIILKNLLLDEEYYGKVYPYLTSEHFVNLENGEIFSSLKQYVLKYDAQPNPKELGLFIKNNNTTAESIKPKIIETYKALMLDQSVENDEFLIQETEKYIQKIELSNAIMKSAEVIENDAPFETVIGLVEKAISISFDSDTGLDYSNSIRERFEYYTDKIQGIPIGIKSIDDALGSGYRKKTLNLIVAPSHGGKSALLVADAANMVMKGQNVLFLTLEMSEKEIARRIDANLINVSANELNKLSYESYSSKMAEVTKYAGQMKIKEYSAGTFNTIKLKSIMTEMKTEGFVPDVIVIDYLTLMSSSRTTMAQAGGTYAYYKLIAEELHGFAKTFDIPVVTAAQLNRGSYDNLEAGLDSIADSLGVIQTADTVVAILSNGQLREMNQAILKFLKNRNTGMLSSHLVGVDFNVMRFTDLDEGFDKQKDAIDKINTEMIQSAVKSDSTVETSIMNFN